MGEKKTSQDFEEYFYFLFLLKSIFTKKRKTNRNKLPENTSLSDFHKLTPLEILSILRRLALQKKEKKNLILLHNCWIP